MDGHEQSYSSGSRKLLTGLATDEPGNLIFLIDHFYITI